MGLGGIWVPTISSSSSICGREPQPQIFLAAKLTVPHVAIDLQASPNCSECHGNCGLSPADSCTFSNIVLVSKAAVALDHIIALEPHKQIV